jgi:hypothetical protein
VTDAEESPNTKIDKAINDKLAKIGKKDTDGNPVMSDDIEIKVIAQAIQWEKVKHHIAEGDEGFNPSNL